MIQRRIHEQRCIRRQVETSARGSKVWWGKLTDDDLDKVAGQFEVFVGLLQEKYGYSREHAEEEIEKKMNEYEATLKKSMPTS